MDIIEKTAIKWIENNIRKLFKERDLLVQYLLFRATDSQGENDHEVLFFHFTDTVETRNRMSSAIYTQYRDSLLTSLEISSLYNYCLKNGRSFLELSSELQCELDDMEGQIGLLLRSLSGIAMDLMHDLGDLMVGNTKRARISCSELLASFDEILEAWIKMAEELAAPERASSYINADALDGRSYAVTFHSDMTDNMNQRPAGQAGVVEESVLRHAMELRKRGLDQHELYRLLLGYEFEYVQSLSCQKLGNLLGGVSDKTIKQWTTYKDLKNAKEEGKLKLGVLGNSLKKEYQSKMKNLPQADNET